ncbi:hypothetical protein E05_06530 [Plautia stali symbiont]|nr:hypothetical protein E05_06530 [Plautia stali symbiont]
MFIEAELGPYFIPSQVNSGYYRLSDGVDAKMGLANGDGNLTYPIKLEERTLLRDAPYWFKPGQGIIYDKFRPMVYISLRFILTKYIIGGAIYIPPI